MENARLLTETREALEQQTATAEVLQVINSSPGDLTPVFDAILEKAHSLCGVALGSLQLYDGERFRAVATHGLSGTLRGLAAARLPARRSDTRDCSTESRSSNPDLAADRHPTARSGRNVVDSERCSSLPLRKDDALLGLLAADRLEVRPFSDKEIALLREFRCAGGDRDGQCAAARRDPPAPGRIARHL